MKYVLVTGGVISGIGKGIIASSTGLLLKTEGLKVTAIKIDPYMNVDAGTMAPTEHGEVFVLDDGGEVDLDLGNYERYLNVKLTRENNITTGKIYRHVIEKERRGDYLGKTVQVVPHLTDATQDWIERVARVPVDETGAEPDACVIELGGTVNDIESAPFLESVRQLRRRAGKGNFVHIHVSLVPQIHGEPKTKPTQQAIKDIRGAGLVPDLIACRCATRLERPLIEKIAAYCQVDEEQVIVVHDIESTYRVPMLLKEQKVPSLLTNILNLEKLGISEAQRKRGDETWKAWGSLTGVTKQHLETVSIALVGKYTDLHDSYMSVIKSLEHASMACNRKLNVIWVDAEHLEPHTQNGDPAKFHKAWHDVCTAQGILVPGGFGKRGTEGMIAAANWARENKTPYLGVCLGMQIAVIEYARNVCGIAAASSEELDGVHAESKIIVNIPEIDQVSLGGTMRLGLRPTYFQSGSEWSRIRKLYCREQKSLVNGHAVNGHGINGNAADVKEANDHAIDGHAVNSKADKNMPAVLERHRHRFEVNPEYVEQLSKAGCSFVGKDDRGERMEIMELRDHPYFVGVQFHPEYLSRVLEPSKPYLGLVAASIGELQGVIDHGLQNETASTNGKVNGFHE
ncbi:CTP synthase [Talaromyces islandicus]|uniref:CTP synthase n=1 Tax=Talaromyces islandicus TaxID=28573 RepID=A0A0U1LYD0_TALIS|nr:CTP synthase [Talaromyces islandicus]